LGGSLNSTPLIDAVGNVYIRAEGGIITGLNGATGAIMWQYTLPGVAKNSGAQSTMSLGPNGILYVAESGTGKVYALVAA
jgi:outer membrane protein assembly factor BamB